jgi:WD40 repeat protein
MRKEVTFARSFNSAEVNAVDFAPDGTKVVSGSTDKNVKLWEVAGGSCILTLDGHR